MIKLADFDIGFTYIYTYSSVGGGVASRRRVATRSNGCETVALRRKLLLLLLLLLLLIGSFKFRRRRSCPYANPVLLLSLCQPLCLFPYSAATNVTRANFEICRQNAVAAANVVAALVAVVAVLAVAVALSAVAVVCSQSVSRKLIHFQHLF